MFQTINAVNGQTQRSLSMLESHVVAWISLVNDDSKDSVFSML